MEYAKYNPPGAQISDDVLAQKYLLYTPSSRQKRKIWVRKAGIHGRIFSSGPFFWQELGTWVLPSAVFVPEKVLSGQSKNIRHKTSDLCPSSQNT
jgi:hypothetical protein